MALTFAWVGHLGEGNPTLSNSDQRPGSPILWWLIGQKTDPYLWNGLIKESRPFDRKTKHANGAHPE